MLHKLSLCVTGGGGAGGEKEVKERDGERERKGETVITVKRRANGGRSWCADGIS